jgi:hypothetical protein
MLRQLKMTTEQKQLKLEKLKKLKNAATRTSIVKRAKSAEPKRDSEIEDKNENCNCQIF